MQSAAHRLDSDSQIGLDRAVTRADAVAVLDAMAGRDRHCDAETAAAMARTLIGLYPSREVHDARAYAAGMTAVFLAHPEDFVRRVCDPARGLPSRLKWLPTLAEVTAAITLESERRSRIAANARHVIALHDAAKAKSEDEARWQASRPSAEQRAEQVKRLLAGFTRAGA